MATHFDLVVRNGTVVSGSGRRVVDVGVANGRFAEIGPAGSLSLHGREELDATGLFALPGLIDGHVHFREPGLEHKEDWLSGSRAAVMGGVTTVLDMPNTVPPTASAADAAAKADLAAAKSYCDFGLFGLLGRDNAADLPELAQSPAVAGLKTFLGPTTGGLEAPSDERLVDALGVARAAGIRVAFHAEDSVIVGAIEANLGDAGRSDARAHLESRPIEAEVTAIERAGRALADAGAGGHILHLTSAAGLAAIERWRRRGIDLTSEVTAHHCFLSAYDYKALGGLIKVNPPIRDASEGEALLAALANGGVDAIASDHAPHAPEEKQGSDIWAVAAGIAGVETTPALFLTHGVNSGRLTLERFVAAMSEAPARIWGLSAKGRVEVGADADLTIVDVEREGVLRGGDLNGMHPLTPFEGWPTRGAAVTTIVRGRIVMRDGELIGEPGWGRLVEGRRLDRHPGSN